LTNFKNVIINVSIDGIGNKFTYMRHPGKWEDAQHNINEFFKLEKLGHINVIPVVAVSALNVWNVNDVFEYFRQYNVEPFIILVQWPQYYCVNVLPNSIKPIVGKYLQSFNNKKFDSVINLLNTQPTKYAKTSTLTPWEEFKFWTKEKDEYRNENFINTFNEIGKLLIEHNEW
jgi:hypothetical protein